MVQVVKECFPLVYLTHCYPMDCSPTGSSVHGFLQAGILEWGATLYSRGSSRCRDPTHIFRCLQHWQMGSFPIAAAATADKSLQSCLTLCDPMDWSLLGSSVHGILQARILEWVAISFSRESSPTQTPNPGLPHCRQILYCLSHREVPDELMILCKMKSVQINRKI